MGPWNPEMITNSVILFEIVSRWAENDAKIFIMENEWMVCLFQNKLLTVDNDTCFTFWIALKEIIGQIVITFWGPFH